MKRARRMGSRQTKSPWLRRFISFFLFVGVLVVWLHHVQVAPEDIQFDQIRFSPLFLFFIITLSIMAITAIKWKAVVDDLVKDHGIRWSDFFHFTSLGALSGLVATQLGNLGLRGALLKIRHQHAISVSLYGVLLDQMMDLISLAVFIVPSLFFFWAG